MSIRIARRKQRAITYNILFFILFVIYLVAPCPAAAGDPFPMPDVLAPNVAFWQAVYTRYTTCQGIVHDNVNLGIIYEIIDLVPYDTPGAALINRNRIRETNESYRRILQRLARNPDAADEPARRVARLWGDPRGGHVFQLAAQRVRCQTGRRDRFEVGLVRSGAYLDDILGILRKYGLPDDLAYLPHVESSFDAEAYSRVGAAGLWQFMPATGRRFMEVGYVLDERHDPMAATHAAARLLRENHARLGDWPLAITAYNHGTAGMERAKLAHGDIATIVQHYKGPAFGFASRNFYAQFLAARRVAADYQSFFGALAKDRPPRTRTVKLNGYAAFDDLSAFFGVDRTILGQLNPALRPPVINGEKLVPGGYALRLPETPWDNVAIMTLDIPDRLYHGAQRPSRYHEVRRGETVGKIARMHGVRAADLILANGLDRRAVIHPRQVLRIPGPGEPDASIVAILPMMDDGDPGSDTACNFHSSSYDDDGV